MTLAKAREVVDYLAALGVTHLYSAPLLAARAGSTHGYDVIDPTTIDPAIGGDAEMTKLARDLHAHGLGMVLDIVPNHMAADVESPYFTDVLRHGPASLYAEWFDVDWRLEPGRSHARLILPALGEGLEKAARGRRVRLDTDGGRIVVRYFDRAFPLDPATIAPVLAAARVRLRDRSERRVLTNAIAACRSLPSRAATDEVSRARRAAVGAEIDRMLATASGASRSIRSALARAAADLARGEGGRRRLERLLAAQAYRLGYWRRASRELNYRRFFNINELIALRTEDPAVFAATHGRVLELVASGEVHALRIDHIDGLLEPGVYLARLRKELARRVRATSTPPPPVYVEKILAADERLPAHWSTVGTTGYEFANRVEDLFIAPHGLSRITRYWAESTGLPSSFEQVARAAKRRALEDLLAPDVERVVATLCESAHGVSATSLRRMVVETIVDLPVYRAYLDRDARRLLPESRVRVERALASAVARTRRATGRAAAEHLSRALLTDPALVKRFGQVSGPAAAKGIEDTAFYVHVPLASRNEVGADPARPPNDAVAEMHRQSAERARRSPGSMLAVTTHDTKRSADARARLDVLSEVAGDWIAAVERWRAWNARLLTRGHGAPLPDPNTEYLLYQSLVALWPMHGADAVPYSAPSHAQLDDLRRRLGGYTEKAAREAGRLSSWTRPNVRFERALRALVDEMLSPSCPPYEDRFVRDVTAFVARVARPGLWSSLARTVLQLSAPGVPDIYQGDELWTFSLVDPDNRRPVDFDARRALLADVRAGAACGARARMAFLASLAEHPEDGRIKLYTVHCLLGLRRRHADLFAGGAYVPLPVEGAAAGHVLAFARTVAGKVVVVVVPRLVLTLTGDPFAAPLGATVWEATEVVVPGPLGRRAFRSVLTGMPVRGRAHSRARVAIDCGDLFNELPVAVIVTA